MVLVLVLVLVLALVMALKILIPKGLLTFFKHITRVLSEILSSRVCISRAVRKTKSSKV